MLPFSLLLIAAVQDTAKKPPVDSYDSEATRSLVSSARAARDRNERLVTAYQARVSQRVGVGIRAGTRDRMLFRQELNAKIEWQRDAKSKIEVIGAREGIPIAFKRDQVPEDLEGGLRDLVVNPGEDYFRLAGMVDDDEGFVHPLKEGGERDYRFALGDSTIISLPSGKRVRIVELKVIPRRSDWRLMSGSLWFDADSYGVVRMVFRPARPFELRRDADKEDMEDVPAWVNATGEVKFVTMEYGLYEDRWWMLRYLALDAVGSMGSWLGLPIKMERVYSDYEVEGGTPPDPSSTFRPAGTVRRPEPPGATPLDSAARKQRADSIRKSIDACVKVLEDSLDDGGLRRREERVRFRQGIRRCTHSAEEDSTLAVVIPDDSLKILNDSTLGPPILDMGDFISEKEIKGLADAIGGLPGPKLGTVVEVPRGLGSLLEKVRYNRVEALSVAARGKVRAGRFQLDGEARFGVADQWPNLEVGASLGGTGTRVRLAGYRRLAAANPEVKPFGAVNSSFAFFAHRDDGEYFRTQGLDLTVGRPAGRWNLRFYAERQTAARTETDWALSHLFGSNSLFQATILADSADQLGVSGAIRGNKQVSRSLSLGGELAAEAATGDFDFGRAQGTVRSLLTPPGPLSFAFSASAGTSSGTVPVQSQFYLGGPINLRGYRGGVTRGSAFWAGRVEVANSFPAARLSLFSDVGWAGPRNDFSRGKPLWSVGLGSSFLDGLIRLDLARGLRDPKGWRFDLYFDGIL